MNSKSEIRDAMRVKRAALAPETRAAASEKICGVLEAAARGVIAVYLASPQEIDLTPFIRGALARGLTLAAPRWDGAGYALARLKDLETLRRGPMGILEPAEDDRIAPGKVDVWIVPGLAFTRAGDRLGYGGGWYDRLLKGTRAQVWGVAYDFQVVEELPSEPHDVRVGRVVAG